MFETHVVNSEIEVTEITLAKVSRLCQLSSKLNGFRNLAYAPPKMQYLSVIVLVYNN
jgi:hypothetical protein